jgi:hypothetical protein
LVYLYGNSGSSLAVGIVVITGNLFVFTIAIQLPVLIFALNKKNKTINQ